MGGGCCIGDFSCCIGDFHCCVFDFFSGSSSCCVGYSSGSSASDVHARKIANELAEMKEKMEKKSREEESKIMDRLNESMKEFLEEIAPLNNQAFGGETLRINLEAIKEKNEALKGQVVGCISKVMNTRLVQTDKELSTILDERDDKKRKKNFEAFVKRVQKQAIDQFKTEVENTVRAQSGVIVLEIRTRQKEVDDRLEETIRELTEIMDVKARSSAELEQKQIGYMYESALCDFLLREVKG